MSPTASCSFPGRVSSSLLSYLSCTAVFHRLSLSHSTTCVSWDHFQNQHCALKSWSQDLPLGEPDEDKCCVPGPVQNSVISRVLILGSGFLLVRGEGVGVGGADHSFYPSSLTHRPGVTQVRVAHPPARSRPGKSLLIPEITCSNSYE